MRILSLLPSATEIVYALGLEDDLVGVSAECDTPAAARSKPTVSWPVMAADPFGGRLSPSEIDSAVVAHVAALEPLYRLDEDLIRALAPDLILAQDLCRVCAVPSGDVTAALDRLGVRARVLSLDPGRLDDVIETVAEVGAAAGAVRRADEVVAMLRARMTEVRKAVAGGPRRRVLALEWSDPPYQGGHWVPDMIDAAGGESLLAEAGERSRRLEWEEVVGAAPEVMVFIPCGYGLDEAVAEAPTLLERPELDDVPEVWALDGSAYFSRPGPRVVDGVELLAGVLHPGRGAPPHPQRATRVR